MQENITSIQEREKAIEERLKTYRTDLTEKQKELLEFSIEVDHAMPFFKIKHFVGDSQITSYQKYKQLLLEIRAREESLENIIMNIARQEAVIEVIYEDMASITSPAQMKLKEFDLITNKNDLLKLHRRLHQGYEERKRFILAIQDMYDTGEAFLEDGTDLKDAIQNTEMVEKLEEEYWKYRLGKQAALDMIATGKIGTGNMEAITMLNQDDQVKTLNVAIDWATRVDGAMGEIQSKIVKQLANVHYDINLKNTSLELE
jgi:hypothetical protein